MQIFFSMNSTPTAKCSLNHYTTCTPTTKKECPHTRTHEFIQVLKNCTGKTNNAVIWSFIRYVSIYYKCILTK